jgi:hypothetical protein
MQFAKTNLCQSLLNSFNDEQMQPLIINSFYALCANKREKIHRWSIQQ